MRITAFSASVAALLLSAAGLTGCGVKQACTNVSNCGDLPTGESESQCETQANNCINALNKGAAPCQKVAADITAQDTCIGTLSCTDLKAEDENGKCNAQNDQLSNDETAAESANCDVAACNQ